MNLYLELLYFYIRLNPKKTFLLVTLSGLLGAIEYLEPYLFGRLIQLLAQDEVVDSRITGLDIFGYWVVLLILLIVLTVWLSLLTQRYAQNGAKILWINFISGIYRNRNPIDSEQRMHSAALLKTGILGSESGAELWQVFIQEQMQIAVGILVVLPLSFLINPYLASILIFLVVVAVWFLHITFRKTISVEENIERIEGEIAVSASELISYQKLVQENLAIPKEIGLFEKLLLSLEKRYSSVIKTWAMVSGGVRGWFSFATLLMLVFGFFFYSDRKSSLGDLVTFVGLLGYMLAKVEGLLNSVQRISGKITIFQEMKKSAGADVLNPHEARPESVPNNFKEWVTVFERDKFPNDHVMLVCENITYRYPNARQDVIKNLSFKVNAGEIVGIKGKTGIGKTTLTHLLMGYLTPLSGSVYINHQNINSISRDYLWRKVSALDQESAILNRSIWDNIVLGVDDISMDRVVEVTVKIGLHEDVLKFPNAYDSMIGEVGVQLSGGQKQLLCLARALVRNPKLLILDEPTSGLDPIAEKLILDVLLKLKGEVTIILISHKESTLSISDQLIQMSQYS